MNQPGQWVAKIRNRKHVREIILEMDSSESLTLGRQAKANLPILKWSWRKGNSVFGPKSALVRENLKNFQKTPVFKQLMLDIPDGGIE